MNLDKYEGLIFDMDGTLLDTMPAHLSAWQQTANHFGFEFDQTWIHGLGGMPSYKIAAEINRSQGLSLDPNLVSKFKMSSFANLENKGEKIDVTCDVLFKHHGQKKLAVGTGSQRLSAVALLKAHKLEGLLDSIVTATDVENHKPHPDTFLRAADELGLIPSQCVVFEDTELGKQAAHAAQMDCIMVIDGNELAFYPYITE